MTLLIYATVPLFAAAGLVLLLAAPGVVLLGFGQPMLPVALHLFTLGALTSGAYLLQERTWERLYGQAAPWRPLLALAWGFHVVGVVDLAWGFARHDTLVAYWGGHYLVPTGVVLMLAHGIVAAWRRTPGTPRALWSHLPMVGLLVAAALGALLVMDARLARYGLYTPATILVHLLAGGFLFLVPLLLLPEPAALPDPRPEAESPPAPEDAGAGALSPTVTRLYPSIVVSAAGVLAVALALSPGGGAAALPLGLALLGGLCLWHGVPLRPQQAFADIDGMRRLGWLVVGLLVLLAAIRVWRGTSVPELLALTRLGVVAFLFGLALPEVLCRLARALGQPEPLAARSRRVQLAGSALLLAGALAGLYSDATWPVRLGALVWLGGLAGPALFALGMARRS